MTKKNNDTNFQHWKVILGEITKKMLNKMTWYSLLI